MTSADSELKHRALPVIDQDSKPFFEGCRKQELLIQRCVQTGKYQHYPRAFSIYTGGEVEWKKVSGKGVVHTYSVVRMSVEKPFGDIVPYVLAMVELQEGVKMMTNIINCDPEDVHIGMEVEVTFSCVSKKHDMWLPFWQPAENA